MWGRTHAHPPMRRIDRRRQGCAFGRWRVDRAFIWSLSPSQLNSSSLVITPPGFTSSNPAIPLREYLPQPVRTTSWEIYFRCGFISQVIGRDRFVAIGPVRRLFASIPSPSPQVHARSPDEGNRVPPGCIAAPARACTMRRPKPIQYNSAALGILGIPAGYFEFKIGHVGQRGGRFRSSPACALATPLCDLSKHTRALNFFLNHALAYSGTSIRTPLCGFDIVQRYRSPDP